MRRASLGLPGALVLLAAFTGLGCSDSLPTENATAPEPVRFALSAEAARAFADALDDVRVRILPELTASDAPNDLASVLEALTGAIAARDQVALRKAMNRTESALVALDASDDETRAIALELDAVRLILDHARPLAYGETTKQ